ncbi:MAG TPA: flagellar motor protein MotB [Deltaproteobacteria bacterium]|nr:flagellar motor protein MotB [Deltaproteobacteria bacterium]
MTFKERVNNPTMLSFKIVMLCAVLALVLQGCASVETENPALTKAKAAYGKANADPQIVANASVPLYEAGQTLKAAEAAKDDSETVHLSYMAEKQTAIAVATAEEKLAVTEREKLAEEKDRILLEQRERQAREARGEAKAMTKEAEKQRMTAEQRAREALEARKQAEAASAQAKELEQELAALKGKKTDRGLVLTLGDVLFVTAKADLMPGAQRTIDQLAAFLNKYPARKVVAEGHTDSRGSEAYNMRLSERRAESVRSALLARGISPDRVTAKGLGEMYPVANNAKAAGRQQNRRVEIVILSDEQAPTEGKKD